MVAAQLPRLFIPFLKFLSSQPKWNRNYRNFGDWQEFLFLWHGFPSKGHVKVGFKGNGNVEEPQERTEIFWQEFSSKGNLIFGFKETGNVWEPQQQKKLLRKTMYVFVLLVQWTDFYVFFHSSNALSQNVGTGILIIKQSSSLHRLPGVGTTFLHCLHEKNVPGSL